MQSAAQRVFGTEAKGCQNADTVPVALCCAQTKLSFVTQFIAALNILFMILTTAPMQKIVVICTQYSTKMTS